ncbi:MAG: phosphoenolpyruvate synthase, partial [Deltaproteobacteria bacterium]|nr:phosphoenolpyruvate synthase [Deltaproteobacteria bacterium]
MTRSDYVRWFGDIRSEDVGLVGGKNASLGEMYSAMTASSVRVPDGFALTARAYRDALSEAGAWERLATLLRGLGKDDVARLARDAAAAREIVYAATGGAALRGQILAAYAELRRQCGDDVALAVRSSATAEDLPTASFAGQHESFLNVRGETELVEACRRCFASVFTDRAIVYRNDNGFDHLKVSLSVGVMKMVRSDLAASGVIFTLDTDSGFRDVVYVTGSYGLGENVVQGRVDPDEFYVHKPTFRAGRRCVLRRRVGRKQRRLVYGEDVCGTVDVEVSEEQRRRFCVEDGDVLKLCDYALRIEEHYSRRA